MKLVLLLFISSLFASIYCECDEEYSIAVISDTHFGDKNGNRTIQYTRDVVNAINAMGAEKKIKYVFITGDITDSAYPTAYIDIEKALSGLKAPYIPIIGNHDTWIYNETYNEKVPTGDIVFGRTFRHIYEKFSPREFVYQNAPHYNRDQNITSWVQNWELELCDLIIFGLDWNNRSPAVSWLGYKGAYPGAQLHDYPSGTFQFLKNRLRRLAGQDHKKKVLFLHHIPYRAPPLVPSFIFGFSSSQKHAVMELLLDHLPKERYIGSIAGHWHRWFDGTAFDEWPEYKQWEIDACKETKAFGIFQIKKGQIVKFEQYNA